MIHPIYSIQNVFFNVPFNKHSKKKIPFDVTQLNCKAKTGTRQSFCMLIFSPPPRFAPSSWFIIDPRGGFVTREGMDFTVAPFRVRICRLSRVSPSKISPPGTARLPLCHRGAVPFGVFPTCFYLRNLVHRKGRFGSDAGEKIRSQLSEAFTNINCPGLPYLRMDARLLLFFRVAPKPHLLSASLHYSYRQRTGGRFGNGRLRDVARLRCGNHYFYSSFPPYFCPFTYALDRASMER